MYYVQNSYFISDVQLHQETQLNYENIAFSELVQVSHIKLLELKTDTVIRNYFPGRNMVFSMLGWAVGQLPHNAMTATLVNSLTVVVKGSI